MWCRKISILSTKQLSFIRFNENIPFRAHLHTSIALNAGHSKWANIRHIKALKDGQKSATFTKYARQIRLAIQEGGSADPVLNSMLRNVIEDALRKNMPMATIQNSIKKSMQSKTHLKKHFLYWRFQQKVFAVCVLYTDSFAQLKMELAPVLRKAGAVYVDAQHIFDDVGLIETTISDEIKSKSKSLDDLEQICMEHAIECEVEEVEVIDHKEGSVNFICSPIQLVSISRALKSKGYLVENSEHVFIPKITVELSEHDINAYQTFLKKVRDLPGIEEIYDNLKVKTVLM